MKIPFGFAFVSGMLMMGAGCAVSVPATVTTPTPETPAAPSAATSSTALDLSNSGLTRLPQSVFTNTAITSFDVSHNALTGSLPGEIRFLQNLRTLDASDNAMTGVPAELGQLVNLHILDLSNNQLTGLPNELGQLKQLQRLDLRGNTITKQDLDVIRASLTATEILE